MPELPEVETIRRGLSPLITGQKIKWVRLYRKNLRWDIPKHLPETLSEQTLNSIKRRAKYLLMQFECGTLIIHLGMSGSIRVVNCKTALKKHDHFELGFADNQCLRLNDPRRFGAVLFCENDTHPLLNNLGLEPLEDLFNETYLYEKSRKKKKTIKTFIMDSKIVVGIGNIYACESLHKAGIHPECEAGNINKKSYAILTQAIKYILTQAIKAGGTTLQDFCAVDGEPGYFAQDLLVYGRENESCKQCSNGKIMRIIQNQRSTFYCKHCQK